MANFQQDISSLIARIEQLEERQNITAKYAVNVKRQLDQLSEQFNELQQHFEQQSTLINGLNGSKPTNGLVSSEAIVVESAADSGKSIMLNNSTTVMLTQPIEVEVKVDEIDSNKINTLTPQEPRLAVFSDEGFKIARMTQLIDAFGDMLLLKAYLAEEKNQAQETPISAGEFLKQYDKGKRDFTGVNLAGANLNQFVTQASWEGNLAKANYTGNWSSKQNLNFSGAKLNNANLSGAYLYKANLRGANLSGTNLSGANLLSANLSGANLKGADLSNANLSSANLNEANLNDAYLYKAKLYEAKLEKATLKRANLRQANLNETSLPSFFRSDKRIKNSSVPSFKQSAQ